MQSSTCRDVETAGREAGRAYGLAEWKSRTLARLLNRQAKQKFGSADTAGQEALDGLARAFACDQLEDLAERLVTASTWVDWLAGVTLPPPAPGWPDYTKDLDVDFEPSEEPSIDTHVQTGMPGGGKALIHLRVQKWYQPDLDRYLYEESRKLERKFGTMPLVAVFLMWPPAEGPGMTGRYEEKRAAGKLKRVFTYKIRRAWEMTPEEVTQSPGTMLLAPLTKDSRKRMPEIMQMVTTGLDKCKADAKMRGMVWEAIYWSMGLICELEEAHRALGEDRVAFIQATRGYLQAKGQAFLGAHAATQHEGPLAAARALVLRQATRRFGSVPAEALEAITSLEELESLAGRVLTAADWPTLFEKVTI
jgi:Domain of unknown function (DUF4351)